MINKKLCALLLSAVCTSQLLSMEAAKATTINSEEDTTVVTELQDEVVTDSKDEVVTDSKDEAVIESEDEVVADSENEVVIDSEDEVVTDLQDEEEMNEIVEDDEYGIMPLSLGIATATHSRIENGIIKMTIYNYEIGGGEKHLECSIYTQVSRGSGNTTAVVMLQAALNKVTGAGLEVDGIFGGATDSALRSFQRGYIGPNEGDGITGRKTWTALNNCIPR